jgi:hypothetical protein
MKTKTQQRRTYVHHVGLPRRQRRVRARQHRHLLVDPAPHHAILRPREPLPAVASLIAFARRVAPIQHVVPARVFIAVDLISATTKSSSNSTEAKKEFLTNTNSVRMNESNNKQTNKGGGGWVGVVNTFCCEDGEAAAAAAPMSATDPTPQVANWSFRPHPPPPALGTSMRTCHQLASASAAP